MDTANLTRDDAARRSDLLEVDSYDVSIDLSGARDQSATTFTSTTRVGFTSRADATTFLDLLAPGVDRVEVNGVALDPSEVFDGNRVTVPVQVGPNVVIVQAQCAYSRSGEGLHRFLDPVDGATYLYTQYEPADSRRVFANFEQPDLKASFTFHVVAPSDWQVRSNTAGATTSLDAVSSRWDFAPTQRISTYITAVVAGPYHRVDDVWSTTTPDGGTLDIDLALFCRASLAEHLDATEIFEVTRAGLDHFHENFQYPYPFGKYDQVFVPEYNLGAMENPGCVTFTEAYVFHAAVTEAERERRANTILHEMAHMWFGDLVTMRWWDDLWLKESFADFMGSYATAEATRFDGAWTTFANRRKAWAYRQDQLPTTHPIVADIPDLEAAKLNFDGITYAKGASVLKQLVAYVGREAFFDGARAYFRAHAFGNASLADFLDALEKASSVSSVLTTSAVSTEGGGRDLRAWSEVWLQTSGTSTLRAEVSSAGDGTVTAATIEQSATDPVTGRAVRRPHRIAVGCYDVVDGVLTRTRRIELEVTGASTPVPDLVGQPRPALVLVNDDDLTYAKTVLDPVSLATVGTYLSTIADSLPRALVWSSIWNAVRDGEVGAAELVDLVVTHLPAETHPGLIQMLHDQTVGAISQYAVAEERDDLTGRLFAAARATTAAATAGSDVQLAWTRLTIATAGRNDATVLTGLLDGTMAPSGLAVDTDLRWAARIALAALGLADVADLDAEVALDDTALARRQRAKALAARPTAPAKATAWASVADADELPNAMVSSVVAGFNRPGHRELVEPFEDAYFRSLTTWWRERTIEIARRLVEGLYPGSQDLSPDMAPAEHPTLLRTDRWLAEHADASASLRRLVVEQRDHLWRALCAQAATRARRAGRDG